MTFKNTSLFRHFMKLFWTIFEKFKAFGMFVSIIINYVMLLVVYTFGVGATWLFVRISRKKLLFYGDKNQKSCWQKIDGNHAMKHAKRMF